jgi:hypothetical protein
MGALIHCSDTAMQGPGGEREERRELQNCLKLVMATMVSSDDG